MPYGSLVEAGQFSINPAAVSDALVRNHATHHPEAAWSLSESTLRENLG
jgi:hypothetical protein